LETALSNKKIAGKPKTILQHISRWFIWSVLNGRFELAQEPDIVFEEMTDIFNSVLQHGNPFDPHAERKTGVFF
jgi:hypothetical protein